MRRILLAAALIIPSLVIVNEAKGHGEDAGNKIYTSTYSSGCCGKSRTRVIRKYKVRAVYDMYWHDRWGYDSKSETECPLANRGEDYNPSSSMPDMLNPPLAFSTQQGYQVVNAAYYPGQDSKIPLSVRALATDQTSEGPTLLASEGIDLHWHYGTDYDCVARSSSYYNSSCDSYITKCGPWTTKKDKYKECDWDDNECLDEGYADSRYGDSESVGDKVYFYEISETQDCWQELVP